MNGIDESARFPSCARGIGRNVGSPLVDQLQKSSLRLNLLTIMCPSSRILNAKQLLMSMRAFLASEPRKNLEAVRQLLSIRITETSRSLPFHK